MSRLLRLPILLFLTAIASNCIQATQISFDQKGSLVILLGDTQDAAQNDEVVFLVPDDDDSDDTPNHLQTEIYSIHPTQYLVSLSHPKIVLTAAQAKRHTVLLL